MNKPLKTALNLLIFALIVGFGYYMIHSIKSEKQKPQKEIKNPKNDFFSPYTKINSLTLSSDISNFYINDNEIYVITEDLQFSIFDFQGTLQNSFKIEKNVRDIVVENETIYLLYPNQITLYTHQGEFFAEWEACSENSDYCSFTATKDYVYVTDAENKMIWQFDMQGGLVRAVKSPNGFIIPSYSFGIMNINDTIYCSNSGRHKIESYTLDGEYITSFGKSGTAAGSFVGCCNPVYLAESSDGNILTSEKGDPRISCYSKDGKFLSVLFDAEMLGGGTKAYRMRVYDENIYVGNGNTILVYSK